MTRRFHFLCCGLFIALFAWSAQAQVLTVTAGEHADFTRVVIRTPPGTQWALDTGSDPQRLTISPPTAVFDLSRLFDRIPRTRLASARSETGLLLLSVPCRCTTRSWEERPGLIVIDISDAVTVAASRSNEPATLSNETTDFTTLTVLNMARNAGISLAQSHSQQQMTAPEPIEPDIPIDALTRGLGLPIAQALTQGLLEPAISPGISTSTLLLTTEALTGNLPENMQITSSADRFDPNSGAQLQTTENCQGVETLEFLRSRSVEPFDVAFGRLTRSLYGEFDQSDPQARRGLIDLYLAAGFGAEARALIENEPDPVVGREFLLGFSDILEQRSSNSRLRLSQMISCGGPATVLAALAGAQMADIATAAPGIALTFTEMNAPLRAFLGQELARILISAGALDAARVVIGGTRRSPWTDSAAMSLVDALLEQARGHPEDAAARLDYAQGADPASIQARLALALSTHHPVSAETLSNAEALASTVRNSAIGTQLMAAIIELYSRSAAFDQAFAAFDQLATWAPRSSESELQINALGSVIWQALSQTADDPTLMHKILARADWQNPALTLESRQALARRLLDLGLNSQVIGLLQGATDALSTEILAGASLALNQPEQAWELLSGTETDTGRRIRASAMAAMGQNTSAFLEFEALNDAQDARTAAILSGNWEQLQDIGDSDSPNQPLDFHEVGQILRRPPGYLGDAMYGDDQRPSTHQNNPVSSNVIEERLSPDAGTVPSPATIVTPVPNQFDTVQPIGIATTLPLTPTDPPRSQGTELSTRPLGAVADVAQTSVTASGPEVPSFDRLGLIAQSETLLGESERLREALTPLVQPQTSAATN